MNKSLRELQKSVDRIHRRFNSWWKIVWFGMLQGAGAVIGAALIVVLISWILGIIGVVPIFSEPAQSLRDLIQSGR